MVGHTLLDIRIGCVWCRTVDSRPYDFVVLSTSSQHMLLRLMRVSVDSDQCGRVALEIGLERRNSLTMGSLRLRTIEYTWWSSTSMPCWIDARKVLLIVYGM